MHGLLSSFSCSPHIQIMLLLSRTIYLLYKRSTWPVKVWTQSLFAPNVDSLWNTRCSANRDHWRCSARSHPQRKICLLLLLQMQLNT
jgi:hypothetical protein